MKIKVTSFQGNIINTLRKAGYSPETRGTKKEISFLRPIRGSRYPRFHVYYNLEKKELNLHFDQKAPQYKNAPDHGAEYDGKLVEKEAERIISFIFP